MTEATMRMEDLRPSNPGDTPEQRRAHHHGEFERVFPEGQQYLDEFLSWGANKLIIKLGADMAENEHVLNSLVGMQAHNLNPIVVHGGGKHISETLKADGFSPLDKVNGVRPTPPEHMPSIEKALNKLNEDIVEKLEELGGRAVGIRRGVFEGIVMRHNRVINRVSRTDATIVTRETRAGSIAVVSCLGNSPGGAAANLNADTAAAAIAQEVRANKLLMVNDEGGINGKQGRVNRLSPDYTQHLIDKGIITDGAVRKSEEADYFASHGIGQVVMTRDFMRELFTKQGEGTIYEV